MTERARDELFEPQAFHGLLLALYGSELMPAQLPVLVSQWSKYYFMLLWREALAGRAPDWSDRLLIALDERGLPVAYGADDGRRGLAEVIDAHLPPLIERLARLGGVPAAVLWGNAGDCLEQVAGEAVKPWLQDPGSPLFAAVGEDVAGRRRRRTCCLSYKVEWVGHCEHCPLLP